MKKSRQQEIDSTAKSILTNALTKWVVNRHADEDFAKDYLVESVDAKGQLTGNAFYVQLKGTESPKRTKDRRFVTFPLETKYAAYYSDKVKDLPVFLVVIDIKKNKGWWVFIQPILGDHNRWRQNKTVTIRLPVENGLADISKLEQSVEEAKAWMRKRHPLAIGEAIDAERERLISIDPRFVPELSLEGSTQHWSFQPKEPVNFTLHFKGDFEDFKKRLDDLREKGLPVEFKAGEAWLTGSPLFEGKGEQGFVIQSGLNEPGEMTMITKDADGKELGRLSDLPGTISGGVKEQWYESSPLDSLLRVKIGPMGQGLGGAVKLKVTYKVWNGHHLSQLPYFDRLYRLFSTLPDSSSTEIECFHKGTRFFRTSIRLQELEFTQGLATLLKALNQARLVCERFGVDPVWDLASFEEDDFDTIEELYGVYFEGGSRSKLESTLTGTLNQEGVESFDRTAWPDDVTVTGYYTYTLLGTKFDVGRQHRKMTNMVGTRDGTTIKVIPTAESELIVTQAEEEPGTGPQ